MADVYVRALYDFEAGNSEELTFQEGDVLKILSDDNQDWYEAELGNETGMVPKNYFEPYVPVVEENGWDDEVTYAPIPQKKKVQIVTVLYDYAAQQYDELSVSEGDVLQIVDDSDPDWYLAKPIARLGESGLVPKTYCEIESGSDKRSFDNPEKTRQREEEARQKEEEKRKRAEQKQKEKEERDKKKEEEKIEKEKKREEERIEKEKERAERDKKKEEERIEREKRREEERKRKEEEARIAAEQLAAKQAQFRSEYGVTMSDNVTTAKVTFYEKRNDKKYWFTVEVYRPTGTRVIYLTYQEFYDFHVSLLELFPEDAGENGKTRIIPYLPGQKLFVNDAVCKQRRVELDQYLQELFNLPERIIRSKLVVEFLSGATGGDSSGVVAQHPKQGVTQENIPPPPSRKAPPPPQNPPGSNRTPPPSNNNVNSRPPISNNNNATNSNNNPQLRPPRPNQGPPRPKSQSFSTPVKLQVGGHFNSSPNLNTNSNPNPNQSNQSSIPPRMGSKPPPPPQNFPPPNKNQTPNFPPPPSQGFPPPNKSQTPNFPPPNQTSNSSTTSATGPTIKVKVYGKNDNIVAFMVQRNVTFSQVKEKAFKKLAVTSKSLQFKDEDGDLVTINGDDDLSLAFEAHPKKLCLYIA